MKKYLFAIIFLSGIAACSTTDKKSTEEKERDSFIKDSIQQAEKMRVMNDTANFTTIQWLDSTFSDMGTVNEGAMVEVSFRFKNTGDKPLVITNVTASCGCTVPEKPEQPFAPGEEGSIKAKFDSKNRPGENRKHISVDANTKPIRTHDLEFTVNVKK